MVPYLHLPEVRFVFPKNPSNPVTLNGGMTMPSWYDIRTLAETPNRESETDIRKTAQDIEALIEREKERGVPANKIILAGFSQGAIAMHVALRHSEMLAGIMALSTYVVLPETMEAELHRPMPLPHCTCHGTLDSCPPGSEVTQILLTKSQAGWPAPPEWHDYPMGHGLPREIKVIARWMWQCWKTSPS